MPGPIRQAEQRNQTAPRKTAGRTPAEVPASGVHTLGNQEVQRLLRDLRIQAKLQVSQPGDRLEQEADQVAEAVMRMPAPPSPLSAAVGIQRRCAGCTEGGEHVCEECSEDEEEIQSKQAPGHTLSLTPQVEAHIESLRGGGQPLPNSVRSFFEPRFGRDFSGVRVHSDPRANEAASALHARAFTRGRDIVFGAGQYAPESAEGQRLLAHELAHVGQQSMSSTPELSLQPRRRSRSAPRRSQQTSSTPTLGSCRPVQDDLRPTAPWPVLQQGYRARCSSATTDVAGQVGHAVRDILGGRIPRAPHLPDARSSVDCACAFGAPEVAAYTAMARVLAAGPLAASVYLHFLQGSGAPLQIDVAGMIARSSGVRQKIRRSMAQGGMSGTTRLEQHDYHDRELQFAYGAIDCVQWVVLAPTGRSWRSNPATRIRVSMLDYYEFHPARPGVSQCAHAANVELVARGSARNFWTRGDAVVRWADLQLP